MHNSKYLQTLKEQKKSAAFNRLLENADRIGGCPVTATMEIIGGKWKPVILYTMMHDVNRFGELDKIIEGISKKVLTSQLRELERDEIIKRKVFAEVPPRVEYSVTTKGKTLYTIIESMCDWGLKKSKKKIKKSSKR